MSEAKRSGKGNTTSWPSASTLLCLLTLGVVSLPIIYNVGYGQHSAAGTPSSRVVNVRADRLEPLLTALAEESDDDIAPTTNTRVEVPRVEAARIDASPEIETEILRIQEDLSQLGYFDGKASGMMDAQTRQAVRAFQQARGLPVTGRMDERFADALTFAMRIKEAVRHTASIGPQFSPSAIRQVQTALTLLGYDAGPIDGSMGTKTIAAIKGFQQHSGLQVNGRIDTNLLRRLGIDGQGNKFQ
jgi:peptidoglycan hydrolase-like protein with peptidoglycan-binding domain